MTCYISILTQTFNLNFQGQKFWIFSKAMFIYNIYIISDIIYNLYIISYDWYVTSDPKFTSVQIHFVIYVPNGMW